MYNVMLECGAGLIHYLNENGSDFIYLYIFSSTLTIQKAFIYLRCPRTLKCQHTHTLQCFFWLSDNTMLFF